MRTLGLRLLLVTLLAAVLQSVAPAAPAAAGTRAPIHAFVDLDGRVAGKAVVLRAVVLGNNRPVLERAACALGCTWRRVATPAVPDNTFTRTVPVRRAVGAWRVRAGRKLSWPVVVTRDNGRTTVRDLIAPKLRGIADVDRATGAIGWVDDTRCDTSGRRLVAAGTVTNDGDVTKDVQIVASWTNETSDVLARDTTVLLRVPAGATRRWRVESGNRSGVSVCVLFAVAGVARD